MPATAPAGHSPACVDVAPVLNLPAATASPAVDRRAARRLPLHLLIEVHCPAEPGRVIEKGLTLDVSAGGLSFPSFNWRQLPAGARCRVLLSLPFESVLFTNSRRLVTAATVVRWNEDECPARRLGGCTPPPPERRGIALKFDEPLVFAASA